jgi:DNA glycosylase AlkZ-like
VKPSEISPQRLISQHLTVTRQPSPKDIVFWMGAMQAQDYPMAKWALGVRLPGSTEADIETAIDNGEIIRTHLLRPTWHFVAAEDIYWMLDLTAPQIKVAMRSREHDLELT